MIAESINIAMSYGIFVTAVKHWIEAEVGKGFENEFLVSRF